MKIEYYATNVGNFFRLSSGDNYYGPNTLKSNRIVEINGINVVDLPLLNEWYQLDTELKDFKQSKRATSEQIGWKLKNPELASEKIPATLSMQELERHWDSDNNEYEFTGEYSSIASLYVEDQMILPEEIVPVSVEVTKLRDLQIDSFDFPSAMQVTYLDAGNYGSNKVRTEDLSSIAVFSDIERMLTPEFLIHTRPCSLTSQQVYKIVRVHILSNIDSKVARVTSNYDFCFTVERVVDINPVEVINEKLTSSGRSYRPPRFTTSMSNSKMVKLFEMTWQGADKGKGYGSYPIIGGWDASNLQELYDNMQKYLSELMLEINKPVVECTACGGSGCIQRIIDIKQR